MAVPAAPTKLRKRTEIVPEMQIGRWGWTPEQDERLDGGHRDVPRLVEGLARRKPARRLWTRPPEDQVSQFHLHLRPLEHLQLMRPCHSTAGAGGISRFNVAVEKYGDGFLLRSVLRPPGARKGCLGTSGGRNLVRRAPGLGKVPAPVHSGLSGSIVFPPFRGHAVRHLLPVLRGAGLDRP